MAIHDLTKRSIADSLRKLLKEKPFANVKVSEICRDCGCERATFYYHFKDKYDLAAWILTDTVSAFEESAVTVGDINAGVECLEAMAKDHVFYQRLLANTSNTFYEHMVKYYVDAFKRAAKRHTEVKELTEEVKFVINYTAHARVAIIREWLLGYSDLSAEQICRYLNDLTPEILRVYCG